VEHLEKMNQLEKIEQRFGFIYPELYKRLYENGMLDWGEFGPDWYATNWGKLKSDPPLLLFSLDIELLSLNEGGSGMSVIERTEELRDPNSCLAAAPRFQFVPFAATGGGDVYAFQFDKQNGEDVPVTFVPHDEDNATVLAKNLQDFIFRQMLECVLVLKA